MKLILGIYFNTVCGSRFNHFYGSQFDLALTCLPPRRLKLELKSFIWKRLTFSSSTETKLCLLFFRSSQAGGNMTKQHTGLKKFSGSLFSQKSKTRQANLSADVQSQETKPRIQETNVKIESLRQGPLNHYSLEPPDKLAARGRKA